ncbi:MAG: prolyl oligopeptidase family serine peptidase [Thermoplasmatales archaeon]|nr:MAG: prolyl oligopeptidase family serine peptidase [Thermoplasmatales archaeon]
MKKKLMIVFAIFVVVFLLIEPAIANSQTLWKHDYTSTLKNLDDPHEEILNGRRFLWKAPSLPPLDDGYPVLFVLHGATQYAESWFWSGKGGLKGSFVWGKRQTNFVENALEKGFFIIAPDSIRPYKFGPKAWDSSTMNFNESKDLPFIQDILDWLLNPPVPINSSRIFCIGFSSGAFMTSRIAYFFGSQFRATAVHSGGFADRGHLTVLQHSFDYNSKHDISEDHPPTLIIHGSKDLLVPIELGVRYYKELQNAGIRVHILLNSNGRHIWQSIFNKQILEWFLYGSHAPEQPIQPLAGPGGSNYSHNEVIESSYGRGAKKYWIFEPAEPKPETAPLVVFNHGWSAMHPRFYRAWIDHIVKRGNIVVYPRYQRGFVIGFKFFSSNAVNAVKNAIKELENGGHVAPDLEKFAITGHSLGGGITANMAARAEEEGLPIPKAIMPVQPALVYDKNADLSKTSNETLMLVIVGEDDTVVGNQSGRTIFLNTEQIPLFKKDFVIQVTDNYGYPGIVADHFAPTCETNNSFLSVDAMDYYCTWKLFDALTDYAFYGINAEYCLGNTPKQRYMGEWSDGSLVKELIVTDTP